MKLRMSKFICCILDLKALVLIMSAHQNLNLKFKNKIKKYPYPLILAHKIKN